MKKLLMATPLYPPDIGGPATYAKELVEGLPAFGIEVVLEKFSDVRHLPKIIRHYVYYRRVRKALAHADVVLALDPVSVGLPAMRAAKKLDKKFIVKIVGDYAWEQGVQRFGVTQDLDEFVRTSQASASVRALQRVQTMVAQAAHRIIVPSPYLKEIVMAWGIAEDKIIVIANAVTVPDNLPTQKKEKDFLVVSAGRRVPWKRFEAIEKLRDTHPNWQIEIISGQPREVVLSWMKAADVFVLNSLYEGFPHTLVEAMTLGTPVVVTDTRAHRHIVGECGLFVGPKVEDVLESALLKVESDPDGARRRAEQGRERMKQFELSAMLDRTAEFLKSL